MPKAIRVGATKHEIIVSEKKADLIAHRSGHQYVQGALDHWWGTIILHPLQSKDQMRQTLLHEVLHACFRKVWTNEQEYEEDVVSFLAPILLDTLQRNPGLVNYLTKKEQPRD